MLYLPKSKFIDSAEANVVPGVAITAEGQALVRAAGAPHLGVMPSTGALGELFVGFAIAATSAAAFLASYNNKVETLVVPGSGIIQLASTPVAGQVFVYDETSGDPVDAPALADNQISGLEAGNTVRVTYKYAMTVVQARALQGDTQPGGYVGDHVGQIGLIKRGLIYTSEFDASVNWAKAKEIRLGANGQVTDKGTGTVLTGAYVVALPSAETAYLGLEFSAA
jgi:hypothetical protein